ncbi:unnamed protein product [Bursaphelenchus xylophilus]|uniref:(pine wood nematode) hypothetical protein n=1 Tax=Bursaphelenchus xylophilus TaxID=6326 RepID=A0A1I7RN05_BURXY|nr:unnamed protein product [Bursaphelenchus xylophilus]CAG9125294.1 unnamed protein product [Bursaphelenchus xylophilus]
MDGTGSKAASIALLAAGGLVFDRGPFLGRSRLFFVCWPLGTPPSSSSCQALGCVSTERRAARGPVEAKHGGKKGGVLGFRGQGRGRTGMVLSLYRSHAECNIEQRCGQRRSGEADKRDRRGNGDRVGLGVGCTLDLEARTDNGEGRIKRDWVADTLGRLGTTAGLRHEQVHLFSQICHLPPHHFSHGLRGGMMRAEALARNCSPLPPTTFSRCPGSAGQLRQPKGAASKHRR